VGCSFFYDHLMGCLKGQAYPARSLVPLSVPSLYVGRPLTLKLYPDRVCFYDAEKLVARHIRSYDKGKDSLEPDHEKPLQEQRKKAKDQLLFGAFLTLSPRAQEYYQELLKRRMNASHHVRQIVALKEIHGEDAVRRAMDDAFEFQAFSCEYIANILDQRARQCPKPGPLHLTRNEDMLELDLEKPDLSIYDSKEEES